MKYRCKGLTVLVIRNNHAQFGVFGHYLTHQAGGQRAVYLDSSHLGSSLSA